MSEYPSTREADWNANAARVQANRAMKAEQKVAEYEATLLWMSTELRKKDREITALQEALKEARK